MNYGASAYPATTTPPYSGQPPTAPHQPSVPPPAPQHNPYSSRSSYHGAPSAPASNIQRHNQSFHAASSNPSVPAKSNPPPAQKAVVNS